MDQTDSHLGSSDSSMITSEDGQGDEFINSLSGTKDTACGSPLVSLPLVTTGDLHDLVCVGFGPASLAIGIALEDSFSYSNIPLERRPKVAFLERQPDFAWHAGMQLPGAKMQISFLKDFATLRNPRSRFTFLNYLWSHNRLVRFTNLSTFLPSRLEYQDYMSWCAASFRGLVHYNREVVDISPAQQTASSEVVDSFLVTALDVTSGHVITYRTRHVVIAVGGKPNIPAACKQGCSMPRNMIHSSQYMTDLPNLLRYPEKRYNIAVVGAGQSGAEIFNDLQSRFPNAQTSLIIRSGALKPSDDSPFVNEIFDPRQTANVYRRDTRLREASIAFDKATNYGVVRLELIERIYNDLYTQALRVNSKNFPQHRILRYRTVTGVQSGPSGVVTIQCHNATALYETCDDKTTEALDFDAVVLATGYTRHAHESMLQPTKHLLPKHPTASKNGEWAVTENYRVQFDNEKVDRHQAGVWLQGCNEKTHGVRHYFHKLSAPSFHTDH